MSTKDQPLLFATLNQKFGLTPEIVRLIAENAGICYIHVSINDRYEDKGLYLLQFIGSCGSEDQYRESKYTINLNTLKPTKNSPIQTPISQEILLKIKEEKVKFNSRIKHS